MWNTTDLQSQIDSVLSTYPRLSMTESDSSYVRLTGAITVYRTAKGFTLNCDYDIQIIIPIGDTLPSVVDVGNAIDAQYPHIYSNRQLCLETDATVYFRFIDGFDLLAWMDEFVEPYYFSYEFYRRYGYFPFGERNHGFIGILQSYQDLFSEPDMKKTYWLTEYIAISNYRGHHLCPCGSGQKIRNCHGPIIMPYMLDIRKKNIVTQDYNIVKKELEYCINNRQ